jgi:cell division protein FtsB
MIRANLRTMLAPPSRFIRLLVYVLAALVLLLQYPLWFGSGGLLTLWQLHREIDTQKMENARLKERNQALEAEVSDLKQGLEAIEERARARHGEEGRDLPPGHRRRGRDEKYKIRFTGLKL